MSPFLGSFLAPKCVPLGYCDEMGNRDEHCPIRPHKDNVLAAWAREVAKQQRPPAGAAGPLMARSPTWLAVLVGSAAMVITACGDGRGEPPPSPTSAFEPEGLR